MHSALYTGRLRHRRFAPRAHQFSYRLFMMYVDLAELDAGIPRSLAVVHAAPRARLAAARRLHRRCRAVHRCRRARSHRRAHGTPTQRDRSGCSPTCGIWASDSTRSRSTTASTRRTRASSPSSPRSPTRRGTSGTRTCSPTPMSKAGSRELRYQFAKEFHVSPFMPMEADYDWRFGVPGERLAVNMQNQHRRRARLRCHARSLAARDHRPGAGAGVCSRSRA